MSTVTAQDSYLKLVVTETSKTGSNYTVRLDLVAVTLVMDVTGTLKLGGTTYSISASGSFQTGATVASKTKTIPYDNGASSDTCTTSFSGNLYILNDEAQRENVVSSLLGYYTSTRPVTASITTSANSYNLGGTVSITTSGGSSGALKWTIGSNSGTIGTVGNTTTSWSIPIATYAQYIPNSASATCTLTWNGVSKSITLNVPNNSSTQPSCSATLAPVSPTGFESSYIRTKSKVKVTVTASAQASATVKSISVSVNGTTYTISPSANPKEATSGYLTTKGTNTCTVTVTDSRGFTATSSPTFSVRDYDPPEVKNINAYRSDSSGTALDSGTYLTVKFTPTITSLTSTNAKKYLVQYKKSTESSWTPSDVDSNYSTSSSYVSEQTATVGGSLSTTALYDVRVIIKDSFEKVISSNSGIAGEDVIMDFNTAGTGGGIGMYTQAADLLDIAWKIVPHKGIRAPGATDNSGRVFIVPKQKLDQSSTFDDEPKEWLSKVCVLTELNNISEGIFIGEIQVGSRGVCVAFIYNTAELDANTGLPRYSFGIMQRYSSGTPILYSFGTTNYTYISSRLGTSGGSTSTKTEITGSQTFSATSSYKYSGLSVTIPANKYFMFRASAWISAVNPSGVIIATASSGLGAANVQTEQLVGTAGYQPTTVWCGKTGSSDVTYYIWAKATQSGNIGVSVSGYYE